MISTEKKPCIKISFEDNNPTIFNSKLGGYGYLGKNDEVPTDENGEQLRLLAQLNLSEVTAVSDLGYLPKEGLLQFWIANSDEYGLNFDNQTDQSNFRVIYIKDIDETVTEEDVKAKTKEVLTSSIEGDYDYLMPIDIGTDKSYGMSFLLGDSEYLWDIEDFESITDDQWNNETGHKIGGHPYFTQFEPRDMEKDNYDFLLLQLDTDDNYKMMWGDSGICNFFINSEKLKALDFSEVFYNWDCC